MIGKMNTTTSPSWFEIVTAMQTGRFLRPSVSPSSCSRFQRIGYQKTSPAAGSFFFGFQIPFKPFDHQCPEIIGHLVEHVNLLDAAAYELLILIHAH